LAKLSLCFGFGGADAFTPLWRSQCGECKAQKKRCVSLLLRFAFSASGGAMKKQRRCKAKKEQRAAQSNILSFFWYIYFRIVIKKIIDFYFF
jgi:hypothetical protein